MANPYCYPGDEVLIRSYGPGEGLSKVLEGKTGIIIRNLGAELRAKGSIVTSSYYRVYIPDLDSERSIKGHFLYLVRRNPDIEGSKNLRFKYLGDVREGTRRRLTNPPEEEFGSVEDAIKFYKAHRKELLEG